VIRGTAGRALSGAGRNRCLVPRQQTGQGAAGLRSRLLASLLPRARTGLVHTLSPAVCEPDQARPARQEWEAAIQRGAVAQLAAPARGGAPGLRNPKAGKSFAQLAAMDDMVDL